MKVESAVILAWVIIMGLCLIGEAITQLAETQNRGQALFLCVREGKTPIIEGKSFTCR